MNVKINVHTRSLTTALLSYNLALISCATLSTLSMTSFFFNKLFAEYEATSLLIVSVIVLVKFHHRLSEALLLLVAVLAITCSLLNLWWSILIAIIATSILVRLFIADRQDANVLTALGFVGSQTCLMGSLLYPIYTCLGVL